MKNNLEKLKHLSVFAFEIVNLMFPKKVGKSVYEKELDTIEQTKKRDALLL